MVEFEEIEEGRNIGIQEIGQHLLNKDNSFIAQLNSDTKTPAVFILPHDKPLTLQIWIFDDLRAVFVIPNHKNVAEQAFFTRKSSLVTALNGIFDEAYDGAA